MPVTPKVLINNIYITTGLNQKLHADELTIIDKFTVTNVSSSEASLTVALSNLSQPEDGIIISNRIVAPNETYTCPEITGHVLKANGRVHAQSSIADALILRASGRELTA